MGAYLRDLLCLIGKDLRIELRSLDGIASMVFLAGVVAFVLAIALGPERATAVPIGTGVLWVSSLLAATVGLSRILERERQHGGWAGLLLSPVSRSALFLAKSCALLVLLLITQLALAPLVSLLFGLPLLEHVGEVGLLLVLGSAGYAMAGTLVGGMALRVRTGDLLLGAVVYPLVVPVLVGGVKGTVLVLQGGDPGALQQWVGLILLSDALYLVAGLWLFDSLVAE